MAYQLIERPYKYAFSNNPVRYTFSITNPDVPGCALEIELYTIAINQSLNGSALGELITSQTLYPNPDGKINFYCEDFLNSYLDWELPPLQTNDIIAVSKQIRKYYVRYRQISKANPSPAWTTDSDKMRIVLKGGIAKEKFDRNNFFKNYLTQKRPFLTWLPDKHFIGTEERRYLTYFHDDENADPSLLILLYLKARVVYTDGTEEIVLKPFPSLSDSLLFHIPAGLQQLGLYDLHPDKKVWYYDVSVTEESGTVQYTLPYRMYADYRNTYKVFSFIYTNSLGGIDTLRIRGEYDIEINLTGTDIQKATGGDFSQALLPTENATINISKYEKFTGDAGWMNTKAYQDACQDLLLSDAVYRVLFNRWLPVVNLQKTQAMGGKSDTKWSFPLQWRYTFDNTQYTPFDLDFGAGSIDDDPGQVYGACSAPSGLAVDLLGDYNGGKKFRFSWQPVGDAQSYELEYKLDLGAFWDRQAINDTKTEVTLFIQGDYSWRVRSKCGENDFSGYVVGPTFKVDFTPAVTCMAPAGLNVLLLSIDGNNASVQLSWAQVIPPSGPLPDYILEWRVVGASVWNSAYVNNVQNGSAYKITVPKDASIEWRVKTKCGEDDYSTPTAGGNFIPLNLIGECHAPTNLNVAVYAINPYLPPSAIFTWDAAQFANNYQLQFRIKDYPDWVTVDNQTSGASYSMYSGQTYEWRVRTICQGGGYSGWTYGPVFNT